MVVGANVCDPTEDLLWFVCGMYVGIFDVFPNCDTACLSGLIRLPYQNVPKKGNSYFFINPHGGTRLNKGRPDSKQKGF